MKTLWNWKTWFCDVNAGRNIRLKKTKWLLLLILILLLDIPRVAARGYQTRIYPSTSGFTKGYLKLSPDGKKIGFAYYKNGKHFVQINNKRYGGFDINKSFNPFIKYSPDSKKFAFIYQRKRQLYLQLNDRIYGGYSAIKLPVFSATGKKVAFSCANGDRWYLWINGEKYGSYQAVELPLFTANEAGAGFAYQKRSKWYFNINDHKYGRFRQVWGPYLSGDGNHFGFVGQKGREGRVYYYLDEERYGPVDRVRQFGGSLDGQSFNVYYDQEDQNYLHPGQNGTPALADLVFPQDGAGSMDTSGWIVYRFQAEKHLQFGRLQLGGYQEMSPLVFGTHYKLWGFNYRQKDGYYVRIGERNYGPYREGAGGPCFSANEKAFAFWYRSKQKIYININHKLYQEDNAEDFALLQLICNDNGLITGYRFRKNAQEFVRMGQILYGGRGTIFPETMVMSNNGACFAYRFRYNKQEYVQINEKIFQCGSNQLTDFVLTPDNKACFASVIDGKIIIQEIDYN